MSTPLRDQWIEQCAKRLMELQPVLRPRVAALAAKDLWEEEQGVISPERRADIEVYSWGRIKGQDLKIPNRSPIERSIRSQAGYMVLGWGLGLVMTLALVGVLVVSR